MALSITVDPPSLHAQSVPPGIGPDSAEVVAGPIFEAGGFHQSLLGSNYRDLWTKPVRLPVLHIATFAGGLTATKVGGGKQTRSLRLATADSVEYVFRPNFKAGVNLPEDFEGTLVWWIFRDAGSASHPAATVAAIPFMDIAGVRHPNSVLVVMGRDSASSARNSRGCRGQSRNIRASRRAVALHSRAR
jgi:hypothetical protein